jgi:hypothetical protein
MEWLSPRLKKFRFQKTKNKVILVTFCNNQGIIHKEFVPPGQTLNMEYVEVLSRLVQRIHHVRPQFQERGSLFRLHDNTKPHTAVSVEQFLAKQGIPELNQPPYFPDLSPPDFFLFPKIKSMLKRRKFEDRESIKGNVTKELLALHANEFRKCFQQFYE